MPMVRFAIDPVLQKKGGGDFVSDGEKIADITEVPERVDFTIKEVDAMVQV